MTPSITLETATLGPLQRRLYEESWEVWAAAHRPGNKNQGAYLPDPAVILRRAAEVRWLVRLEFSNTVIRSILWDNAPSLQKVRQMVEKHGPRETQRRLERFLEG